MQIYDLTVPELNRYRELCNFLDDELEFFNLRARGKSLVQIAIAMNVSESQASILSKKVKSKMERV